MQSRVLHLLVAVLILQPIAGFVLPSAAQADAPTPVGIVEQPCPAQLPPPASLVAAHFAAFEPDAKPPNGEVYRSPEVVQWFQANAERAKTDWANLCRYRADNAALAGSPRPQFVFIGDSITEAWIEADPAFFARGFVDRGISGQTSQQILARFYQDVVMLRPKAVHILAGTNDVAGNLGPSRAADVVNNIAAMIDIARANHIKVVLGAIPPAADFIWRPGLQPASKIVALNDQLLKLARQKHIRFVDYYALLAGNDGGMRLGISSDGVHPNRRGYEIMESVIGTSLR